MLLPFREMKLSDKAWFRERVRAAGFWGSDYSFGNNFIWRYPYKIKLLERRGFAVTTYHDGEVYTMPAGDGGVRAAELPSVIAELMDDANERGVPFCLRGVTEDALPALEGAFGGAFDFYAPDDESDYIYLRDDLAVLAGKKFHGKRNHIARFVENDDWSFEPITRDNFDAAYDMALNWCVKYDCAGNFELEREFCAVKQTFANFFDLDFEGAILRLNGEVVAVTAGEQLNDDVFVTHIEKAYHEIQGAYPTINREFAKMVDCKYINREEDDGDEGLRRAKLSYHPEVVLRKFQATLKSERARWPERLERCAV